MDYLKSFENIKREAGIPYFSTLYDLDMWRKDLENIEKAIKTLEIIKNHIPFIYLWLGWIGEYKDEYRELIYELYRKEEGSNG